MYRYPSTRVPIIVSLSTLFFILLWFSSDIHNVSADEVPQENYAWVLVNEIDDHGIYDLEEIEARLKNYDDSSIDSSLNNTGYYVDYSVKKTFAGLSSAAQSTISTTPLEIQPDTPIPLNLRVSVTENEGYDGGTGDASASARVMFCDYNSTTQDFKPPILGGKPFHANEFTSESGESQFDSNDINVYPTHNTTISASLPAGTVHGETIAICANTTLLGVTMGTVYRYIWLPSGSGNVTGINKKYDVPKDENGDYIDSGVRVSDISGEVYIRRGDASAVEWEMLNVDDVIYQGDMIHTKTRNSHCSLSLSDMTTFDMRPRTGLIINTMSEKESALSLLAGKVLVNVKKMIKDGSMNVEMSQCIAGARGTIFTLESNDTTSHVKVLEGTVETKSNNGENLLLTAGEQVSVTDGALQEKRTFVLNDELRMWNEATRNALIADITERTGNAPDLSNTQTQTSPTPQPAGTLEQGNNEHNEGGGSLTYVYIVVGLLLIAGGIFWYRKH